MSSSMKKILIAIIAAIFMILGYVNISNAKTYYRPSEYKSSSGNYSITSQRYLGYQQYQKNKNTFCLEHHERLWSDEIPYRVTSIVTLQGHTATGPKKDGEYKNGDPKLKQVSYTDGEGDVNINAKLFYVLAGLSDASKTQVQETVWWYMDNWIDKIGRKFYGINAYTANSDNEGKTDLTTEAKAYAKKLKEGNAIDDKTNKDNVKVEASGGYIYVGPFKWEYEGDLIGSEIKVLDQNGNAISNSNVAFGQYKGSKFKEIKKKDIPSGEDFYIRIKSNAGISKITGMIGKIKTYNTSVDLIFFKPVSDSTQSWQNLMVTEVHSEDKEEPFDFSYYDIPLLGDLWIKKVNTDDNSVVLNGVGFKFRNVATNQYICKNGSSIYYSNDINQAYTFITGTDAKTKNTGEIQIEGILLGDYEAIETVNPNYGYDWMGSANVTITASTTSPTLLGNKQRYVRLSGYVWIDRGEGNKETGPGDTYYTSPDSNHTSRDELFRNVRVRVIDTRTGAVATDINGNRLETTTTSASYGKIYHERNDQCLRTYVFNDVLIDNLQYYTVEFTYDGLTYQSVDYKTTDIQNNTHNASKATEGTNGSRRAEFNNDFSSIEGGNSADEGVALDENGNKTYDLKYDKKSQKGVATLINNGLPTGQYPIKADTSSAGCNIRNYFTYGMQEIPYLNLGLYLRNKPDLIVGKDLENVQLDINGKSFVYEYSYKTKGEEPSLEYGFNVGVMFENRYEFGYYSVPIYRADAMYDTEDNSNELQVKMTYRISIQNESSDVITQVNRLVEYYDSRYTLSAIGRGDLTENNEIPNKLSTSEYSNSGSSYEGYNQLIINSPVRLQPSNQDTIFVQFDLSREAVLELLNTSADDPNRGLDNVIEILSYSSFESDGTAYAGVDVDSNPGNAKPTDLDSTYEDDTTASPRIMLNVKDARKMTGKVFEDEPLVPGGYDNTDGIMTGQERIGNGEYDGGEVGIGGVDVTLQESTGALTYQTITVSEDGAYTYNVTYVDADGNEYVPEDSNRLTPGTTATVTLTKVDSGTEGSVELTAGDFYIPNYIPGDYTLSYTWGDETYTVQNYKATIYNEPDRQNSPYHWHITDTRQYSDALDDYVTRQSIDAEYNDATYETATKTPTITEMVSTTPTMSIEVENTTETTSTGAWLEYKISNIDFGIIERAKQDISLDKRVSKMTVLLANGNPLVDFTIDEEGNLEGEHANVTYMEPSDTTTPRNGFVRLEMDTELMEGAILQVEYTYTASNNSEVDYATEDYYNYGTDKTNVVTITPSEMVDYLDSEWSFDANSNGGWSAVTTQNGWTPTEGSRADNNIDSEVDGGQVQWVTLAKGTDDFMLKKASYDGASSTTMLYTGNLATALQPGGTNSTTLNVSKTLSSGDINLENEAELVREEKNGGAKILTSIPGNYMVGTGPQVEPDDDMAPTVMITPNTGDNLNYILPIAVVVTAFVIIGVGIVFIKKKVLNK